MSRRRRSYQFFDPLPEEQFAALVTDIGNRGQRIPAEVDDDGNVITGHERIRACAALGIEPKVVVLSGLTEEATAEHAILDNVLRRQLGPIAKAKALLRLADLEGATLGSKGGPAGDRRTVQRLAELFGADRSTAYRWIAAAKELEGHPDLAARVDAEQMELRRALILARERAAKSRPAPHPEAMPDAIDIRLGNCADVLAGVPDGSADLVFTDPPWLGSTMAAFSVLGALAARLLKPGGYLLAYAGQYHMPEAIERLSEHLRYHWAIGLVQPGKHPRVHARRVINSWRPVLVFAKPGPRTDRWFFDLCEVEQPPEKILHPWEQSISPALHYIDALTQPGDLIVDPFVGSGTTAVAAYRLGRRFVGAEVDPEAWNVARVRIADEARGAE
jgi:site-specific DNA-methyltransferase (adenine-specific)